MSGDDDEEVAMTRGTLNKLQKENDKMLGLLKEYLAITVNKPLGDMDFDAIIGWSERVRKFVAAKEKELST